MRSIHIAKDIVSNKDTCHLINVGAHIGTLAIPLSNVFTKVTAFEPCKPNFDHLELNIKINEKTNIDARNVGLSHMAYTAPIVFTTSNTGGTHVLTQDDVQNSRRHSTYRMPMSEQSVNCVTLDSCHFECPPDLMLVDIEGHESYFVQGGKQTLMKHLPTLIIEIWTDRKRRFENIIVTQTEQIHIIFKLGYSKCEQLNDDTFLFSA